MGLINIPNRPRLFKPIGLPQIDWDDPLAVGLIGYWGMLPYEAGGNTIQDLSGNGNTGTLGAGAASPSWIGGAFGPALSFDGGDYVNCGTSSLLDITGAITIVFSAKTTTVSSTNFRILSKGETGTNRAYLITYDADDDRLAFGDAEGFVYRDNENFNDGLWHRIIATYDGSGSASGYSIYFDGVKLGLLEAGTANGFEVSSEPFLIGAGSNDGAIANQFPGQIDNVMIYNRALSVPEIALLYREPFRFLTVPRERALFVKEVEVAVGTILPQITSAYMRI